MVAAEHVLELPQQCRSFLELRRVVSTPDAPLTADAAEIESQEAEAVATTEVYDSTLLFIDLDLQLGQLLPQTFLNRPHQPAMSWVGVNQDHQIVCKTRVLEVRMPYRSDFGTPCCLRPSDAGSALGSNHFRGHIRVHCRYGPAARGLPKEDLVDRLQGLGFPPPCYPNYRAPDSCPGRSVSC